MNLIESWLYETTNVLLIPVAIALLALLAFTLITVGGFVREVVERRASTRRWQEVRDRLLDRGGDADTRSSGFFERSDWPGLIAEFAREGQSARGDEVRLSGVASRCEIEASRRVARLNLIARAGPTLGLMATLIPMGPALLSLAESDVTTLARSLVVAFTSTIVGLLIGLLCAAMASMRRHWYAEDLAAIDELLDAFDGVRA